MSENKNKLPEYIVSWNELKTSKVARPKDNANDKAFDLEVMRRVERHFAEVIDASLMPKTTARKRPLSPLEVAYALRQSPHWLLCAYPDCLAMVRALRRHGFSFKRIRRGNWQISEKDGTDRGELHTSKFLKKGENYMFDKPEPFKYELKIDFEPRPEFDNSMLWRMRYGGLK